MRIWQAGIGAQARDCRRLAVASPISFIIGGANHHHHRDIHRNNPPPGSSRPSGLVQTRNQDEAPSILLMNSATLSSGAVINSFTRPWCANINMRPESM